MTDQTAMLLTQQEWEDLALMCRVFKLEREPYDYDEGVFARCYELANRIIDASAP